MHPIRSWPNPNAGTDLGELSGSFKYLDLDIRIFRQSHSERQTADTPTTVRARESSQSAVNCA